MTIIIGIGEARLDKDLNRECRLIGIDRKKIYKKQAKELFQGEFKGQIAYKELYTLHGGADSALLFDL